MLQIEVEEDMACSLAPNLHSSSLFKREPSSYEASRLGGLSPYCPSKLLDQEAHETRAEALVKRGAANSGIAHGEFNLITFKAT